jgi:hypothetical protein
LRVIVIVDNFAHLSGSADRICPVRMESCLDWDIDRTVAKEYPADGCRCGTDYTLTRTTHFAVGSAEIKSYMDVLSDAISRNGIGSTVADVQKIEGSVDVVMTTHRHIARGVANNEDNGPRPPTDPSTAGAEVGDSMTYHNCVRNRDQGWVLEFKYDGDADEYRWWSLTTGPTTSRCALRHNGRSIRA